MKKFVFISIILAIFAAVMPVAIRANEENPHEIPLTPYGPDEEGPGHRLPPAHIQCVIDMEGGVTIDGIDSSDIISYEIYAESGEGVGLFADEQSFLSCLRTCSGTTVRLVFRTADTALLGWLSL